jgi:hypothetical protein
MAIVSCPFCGKKISSKAASCNHCGEALVEVTPEQLARTDRDRRLKLNQSINNHAMMALVLFLGSFLYFYYKIPEPGSLEQRLTYAALALSAIWYIVSKVRMVLFKRQ